MHRDAVHEVVRSLLDEVTGLADDLHDPVTARELDLLAPLRLVLHARGLDEPFHLARLSGGPGPDHAVALVSDVAGRWAVDLTARGSTPGAPVPLVTPASGCLGRWARSEVLDLAGCAPELWRLRTGAWPYETAEQVDALLAGLPGRAVRTVGLHGPYARAL